MQEALNLFTSHFLKTKTERSLEAVSKRHKLADLAFLSDTFSQVSHSTTSAKTLLFEAADKGSAEAAYCFSILSIIETNGVPTKEAIFWLEIAAKRGHPKADCKLGSVHKYGWGVQKDTRSAVKHLKVAAKQGDARAIYELGGMYLNGQGVTKDICLAERLFMEAARKGSASAQCDLGVMNKNINAPLAVEYFMLSAEQKNACGQFNLGVMYQTGLGVGKDESLAAQWFRKASDLGYMPAHCHLGDMYKYEQGITRDLARAVFFFRRAAEQGSDHGQYNLAVALETGQGIPKNDGEAAKWYGLAASQGHTGALCRLGVMFETGRIHNEEEKNEHEWNKKRAFDCYAMAATQGDAHGQCLLGFMYEHGKGVEKQETEALKYYSMAAAQGHALALCNLGCFLMVGRAMVEANAERAVHCFRAGAERGNGKAQFYLAYAYEFGLGVDHDNTKAIYWYECAKGNGENMRADRALFVLRSKSQILPNRKIRFSHGSVTSYHQENPPKARKRANSDPMVDPIPAEKYAVKLTG